MQKAKEYDWKDSNMAMFGSETEKNVKKESAETEKAWRGAGQAVGQRIWRINKFKVEDWPLEQYGEFYNGDSYIILNTFKEEGGDELNYDLHFWIGKHSTQDEYGTAAYKTVELDTFLDDKPIQHREVQGHESALFKSYFDTITLLKGGADSGFRKVLPEQYQARLFHVKKQANRKVTCTQVSLKRGNLTSDDVFIIDNGNMIYQWNGSKCSPDEKFKASQEVAKLKNKRGKARSEVMEENDTTNDHPAIKLLKDESPKKKKRPSATGERKMFRVSDAGGRMDMTEVAANKNLSKGLLDGDDVFVINTGDHVYCWIGQGASIDERKNGLTYASSYLNKTATPWLPISVVAQGKEGSAFIRAF